MVENSSSSMFLPVRFGSCCVLILCVLISSVQSSTFNQSSIQIEENSTEISAEDEYSMAPNISLSEGMAVNSTEHQGFLHGFVESLSVILVSELGDKTFFIAAILAMQANKLTVFLAAITALAVMTVLSALLGFVVTTFIPRVYTYYACTAIMFLFGIKMLWEAWRMKDNELEEVQREVEEEIARRGSIASSIPAAAPEADAEAAQPMNTEGQVAEVQRAEEGGRTEEGDTPEVDVVKPKRKPLRIQIREKSWFGKKCVKIFKVFTNTFGMTFLAEWGDRSQLATIVMAGINDVAGVCVGGVLGHFICTGLAVICGALIAKKISVRKVTLIGALVFIGFAIASLFIDPNEENHLVPDVQGDDHNATEYLENHITFVETSTVLYSTAT